MLNNSPTSRRAPLSHKIDGLHGLHHHVLHLAAHERRQHGHQVLRGQRGQLVLGRYRQLLDEFRKGRLLSHGVVSLLK